MIAIYVINTLLIAIAIIIHYEALLQLSIHMPRLTIRPRFRVAIGLIGAMAAHIVEIWVFGIAYYLLIHYGDFGHLAGELDQSLLNCVYFSFVTYTSLGFGDQLPVGLIRFTAGLEALTGLVVIAMTASFMYFQLEKYWSELRYNVPE